MPAAGPGPGRGAREPGLSCSGSVAFGAPWLLDQLWQQLGIGAILTARLGTTRRDTAAGRALFALVANRALDPSSKLAAAHWVGRKAWIDRLPGTSDDACYRAMDWLHQVRGAVEQEIFGQVANLLNLEVDLLFFGTTSTCFELDEEDEPMPRDKNGEVTKDPEKAAEGKPGGFRAYGQGPSRRPAPGGHRHGPDRVGRRPRLHLRGEPPLPAQRRPPLHHREKLRSGSAEARAALSRQGRYQDVAENLRVKEVKISDSERFVICYNPQAAERDAKVRERMLAQLNEMIKDSGKLTTTKRAELRGVISAKPGLNRYLRVTPGGLLRIDAAAIKAGENLDGKYLLRTSGPRLSAEDTGLSPLQHAFAQVRP
jgi:hypothetical protein